MISFQVQSDLQHWKRRSRELNLLSKAGLIMFFLQGSEAAQPIWYVMDEFGSRIQHSDDPNFRVVPFFFGPSQMSFSIMWPLRNVGSGGKRLLLLGVDNLFVLLTEEVTRNYIEGGVTDSLMRKIRLLPWHPEDMRHLSFEQHEVEESFFNVNDVLLSLKTATSTSIFIIFRNTRYMRLCPTWRWNSQD